MKGRKPSGNRKQKCRATPAQRPGRPALRAPQNEAEWRRRQHKLEVHQILLERQNEDLRMAKAEIEAGLERFTELYDFAPVGYFDLAKDGTIRLANHAGAKLTGRERDELIGQRFQQFIPRTERSAFNACLRQTCATRAGQSCTINLLIPKQARLVVHLKTTPAPDGKRCRMMIWDITAQVRGEREIKASELKYRRLFESLNDAYASVSMAGQILEFNPAYRKMLGYTSKELFRKTYLDLTPKKWHALEVAIVRDQVLPRGYSEVYTKEYRRKDGTIFPVELRTFLIRDHAGKPAAMWAIIRDITERRQAERALRRSEERFRAITDFSPDIISIFDRAGRLVFNSAAAARIHGYSAGELERRLTFDYIHPEDRPAVGAVFESLLKSPDMVVNVQYRYRNADGSYKWMEAIARNELANPHINGLLAISRDITERKAAESEIRRLNETLEQRVQVRTRELEQSLAALRKSEERFRAIADHTPDHVIIQDRQLRYQLVINPHLGLTEAEMIGKTERDLFGEKEAGLLQAIKRKVLKTGKPVHMEMPFPTTKGAVEYFEGDYIPKRDAKGRVDGLIGYFRNVTVSKELEDARLETLARFSGFSEASQYGMGMSDLKGRILFVNPTLVGLLGEESAEACLGKYFPSAYYSPAMARKIKREVIPAVMRAGHWQGELELITAGGTRRPTEEKYFLIRDAKGQPRYIADILTDITWRKQAEATVRKSEQRYRVLFNSSRDALLTLAPPLWHFTTCNPAAVEMFRASDAAQLLATAPWELSPTFQPNGLTSAKAARLMIETALRQGSHAFEWWHRRFDGEEFPASVLLTRVELEGQRFLQGTVRDITERVRLEREILEISEQECQRIAGDLHDGLGQVLFGAVCLANSLHADLTQKSLPEAQSLARIQSVLNGALVQTRKLALGLHPVDAQPNGLMVALGDLAEQTRNIFRLRCDFECHQPVLIQDNNVATHLFRIAQESVTNAIKHGRASHIRINLTRSPDRITLSIKDNGTGKQTGARKKSGMGVNIMRYRARMIGGIFTIQHKASAGTHVLCKVHYPNGKHSTLTPAARPQTREG